MKEKYHQAFNLLAFTSRAMYCYDFFEVEENNRRDEISPLTMDFFLVSLDLSDHRLLNFEFFGINIYGRLAEQGRKKASQCVKN